MFSKVDVEVSLLLDWQNSKRNIDYILEHCAHYPFFLFFSILLFSSPFLLSFLPLLSLLPLLSSSSSPFFFFLPYFSYFLPFQSISCKTKSFKRSEIKVSNPIFYLWLSLLRNLSIPLQNSTCYCCHIISIIALVLAIFYILSKVLTYFFYSDLHHNISPIFPLSISFLLSSFSFLSHPFFCSLLFSPLLSPVLSSTIFLITDSISYGTFGSSGTKCLERRIWINLS